VEETAPKRGLTAEGGHFVAVAQSDRRHTLFVNAAIEGDGEGEGEKAVSLGD
jgi:hypothetical protein